MKPLFTAFLCMSMMHFCHAQDYTVPDSIAMLQTCVASNSINDGQPAPPKLPFVQSTLTTDLEGNYALGLCIAETFAEHGFFRNSLFNLTLANFEIAKGSFDYDQAINAQWQHRWFYEKGKKPTFATIVGVSHPYKGNDESTELQTILVVNKSIDSRRVLFFNAFMNTPVEEAFNASTYGFLVGQKFYLAENHNFFADVIYQSTSDLTLELAIEFNLSSEWVVSPGINYNWNTSDRTNTFGIGVLVLYQSIKRN